MLRAILLLILLFLVIRALPRLLRRVRAPASKSKGQEVAHTVRCAHCAMFVPAATAVFDGEHGYCCDAHRQRGPAPSP